MKFAEDLAGTAGNGQENFKGKFGRLGPSHSKCRPLLAVRMGDGRQGKRLDRALKGRGTQKGSQTTTKAVNCLRGTWLISPSRRNSKKGENIS